MRNMTTLRNIMLLLLVPLLATCVSDTPTQPASPKIKAKLVTKDEGNRGISFKQVLNIAANRKEMSCIELTLGVLQAYALKSVGNSKLVEADQTTRLLAGTIGDSADSLIEQEKQCHCDKGAAMPGYEIFERRQFLQKNKNNRTINQSYVTLYPKDPNGNPRFLEPGEKLDRTILERLPVAPVQKRFDDCGRKCKDARARTNAKALAEGKEEPWPNLERPRKKPCINGVPQTG